MSLPILHSAVRRERQHAGAPVVPTLDPVRMIEPPLPITGSAFWTVKIRTLNIGVEGFVNVLGGDLAEPKLASHSGRKSRPIMFEQQSISNTCGMRGHVGNAASFRAEADD
jgi:hypothetical protein